MAAIEFTEVDAFSSMPLAQSIMHPFIQLPKL